MVERFRVAEYSGQCVVISGGDRIKLVIVTSCTANSLCQKASGDRFELFVNDYNIDLIVSVFDMRGA